MTPLQKITIRLSEVRTRLNEISALEGDALTAEIRAEADTLATEYGDLETRHRSAIIASDDDAEPRDIDPGTATLDAEHRARLELRSKCRVGSFIQAALSGRQLAGAEAELARETGLDGIPAELWNPVEERAITPAPGTVGINLAPIVASVFAPSLAPRLGIDIPQVPTGSYAVARITTAPTAAAVAKSAAVPQTAGALTVSTTTAHRIGGSIGIALEDVAAIGTEDFESRLREEISLVLSAQLDDQLINGSGAGANLTGLLARLGAPTAPAARGVEDWDRFAAIQSGGIDGIWASELSHIAMVTNPATYRLAAATFRGDDGERSAASYLNAQGESFFASARMPDAPADTHIAVGIVARRGRAGLRIAVAPMWGSIVIDDIYTAALKGERYLQLTSFLALEWGAA